MPHPDFDNLCDELIRLGAGNGAHPAELHGLACGILAAGFQPTPAQWLQEAANYANEPGLDAHSPPLIELFCHSQTQLVEGNFEFQLCLPDDELYGLPERSESLARWCQGFLHGFAAIQSPLSTEDEEMLRDITEISRLAFGEEDVEENEDEHEGYYAELTEFVRMVVISLYMDHHCHKEQTEGKNHGHH
jgi:uncharacterized protein YgfB (UPF0149 family)